jgi:RimJ/RimL family protein N-acetyltransferase
MNAIIIETERLVLRQFTLQDSAFILNLLNTEGWLRYIGDRNIKTTQQAEDYLNNGPLKSYKINGFGLGLVALKPDGKPIGMCGLIKRDYLDHVDIGFAFLPDFIGKGYAYEIAKRTLQYGFEQLQQDKILAITLPENSASIRLLSKLGLAYEQTFISKDINEALAIYGLNKEDYAAKNKSSQ